MSNGPLPRTVHYAKLAARNAVVEGDLEPAKSERLSDLSAGSTLHSVLRFSLDDEGRVFVVGHTDGQLQAVCQRCLEYALVNVGCDTALYLLNDEAEARQLPRDADYWVVTDDVLDPWSLVEEDVLLAMPAAVYHESCGMYGGGVYGEGDDGLASRAETSDTKENPFSVLQGLKTRKNDTD